VRARPRHPGPRVLRAAPILAVCALVLAACADGGTGAGPDLAGKAFVWTEIRGVDPGPGAEVRLVFQEDRISVNAGCNTLMAAATWDDGALRVVGPMASTRMACPDDRARLDAWLEAFLLREPRLVHDGGTLVLGDEDEGIAFDEQ